MTFGRYRLEKSLTSRDIINELVPDRASRILMLGCGNSSAYMSPLTTALSKDMYEDGYHHIVSTYTVREANRRLGLQ